MFEIFVSIFLGFCIAIIKIKIDYPEFSLRCFLGWHDEHFRTKPYIWEKEIPVIYNKTNKWISIKIRCEECFCDRCGKHAVYETIIEEKKL